LVLPNAWDAGSAKAIEAAGARAVATTSAGVSWALGVEDGGGLSRADALDALRRIVAVVSVPVNADIEAGYGATPADVASTVAEVIEIGAVGINLEDSLNGSLLGATVQAERIASAREAAVSAGLDLCINARADTYLCTPRRALTCSSYQASPTHPRSRNSWPGRHSPSTSWSAQEPPASETSPHSA
jgi:2-methylisocitrate lyase-like PEP mutase family enzyme